MAKQPVRLFPESSPPNFRQIGWSLMALVLIGFLTLIAWSGARTLASAAPLSGHWASGLQLEGSVLGLVGVHALLAAVVQQALIAVPMSNAWRYRAAFLASAGLGLARWMTLTGNPGANWDGLGLLAATGGAFLGSLLITGLEVSLWENNSPPPERVQLDVIEQHQVVIGSPLGMQLAKRVFDIVLAVAGLILSAPLWLLIIFVVWFEDPGPVLFVKNSVGKGGRNFFLLKFRTMVRQAEHATGPILASEQDERVLRFGRLLRKTALDELPQLLNILAGQMSFVGPRPQRTVLVQGYLERMPEYAWRHSVSPGLAGLAQVAGHYYLTPRQKLRYDRIYIRHASLGFDLKLLLLAFLVTFWYRWQPGWNDRLPRHLLHSGARASSPRQSTR